MNPLLHRLIQFASVAVLIDCAAPAKDRKPLNAKQALPPTVSEHRHNPFETTCTLATRPKWLMSAARCG